jgi:hypothetical protein
MLQFVLYNAMVYCVKGFGKIKENTDSKFSLVYRGSNFIIYMTTARGVEWPFLKPNWFWNRIPDLLKLSNNRLYATFWNTLEKIILIEK